MNGGIEYSYSSVCEHLVGMYYGEYKNIIHLAEYLFLGLLGLPWGDKGGKGGVTEDTLSDKVECAIAGTSLGSKILLNSDSTISTHSESCPDNKNKLYCETRLTSSWENYPTSK